MNKEDYKYVLTPEKEEEIIKVFNPNWDGNKNMQLLKYVPEFQCKMCLIKGEQGRGEYRNNVFKTLKGEEITINEVLCDKHFKILLNYAKKFNWEEEKNE